MDGLRVGICAIAKDEGSYLEEWIAYHHLMGFAPIRIYAHDCSDNTHAVLMRLSRSGLCEWTPFTAPPGGKPHWLAYADGTEALRDRTDWLAFIDIDELLVTPRHGSIQAFLAEFGHLGAIAVNWRFFGSNGHVRREPGLVLERFTRCAPTDFRNNRMVKTLARTDAIVVPRVHTCDFAPGVVYQTVNREALPGHAGSSQRIDHDAIRVHHYFTRSREEWDAEGASSATKHRSDIDFAHHDRNDEEDTTVLRWAEPIRQLIAEINAAHIDAAYTELDAARRRADRLALERDTAAEALARSESQRETALVALRAEADRSARLQAARAAPRLPRRLARRVVRLTRRRRVRPAAERQLPAASAASVSSLTSHTNASGR